MSMKTYTITLIRSKTQVKETFTAYVKDREAATATAHTIRRHSGGAYSMFYIISESQPITEAQSWAALTKS
jgi:hypothetical protein